MGGRIGIFSDRLVDRLVRRTLFLIARQGDIGTGFEELLPELDRYSARV